MIVYVGLSLFNGDLFSEQFHCDEKEGVRICVNFHGSSSFSALIPEEKISMKLDIFYVRIENNSPYKLTVSPVNFSCVDLVGQVFAIDLPLYEKIKWSKKLQETTLEPGRKVEGYIFCPGSKHPVRVVAYQGDVILEVTLY